MKLTKNKKGVELTLQTIVVFIIAVIVLVMVVFFFLKHYDANSVTEVGKGAIDVANSAS
ncbi:MAG: hypothetical protein ACOCXG_03685 [Nanoarchaeota archaeon]